MLPILLALLLQDPAQSTPTPAPAPAPKATQPESESESEVYDEESLIQEFAKQGVTLHKGPYTGELGPQAQVAVPEGCFFADGDSTRKFLELSQNIAGGDELGMILCLGSENAPSWSAYFSFSADGYIKDNEEIDADQLMEVMKEGNQAGNEERRRRGWPEIELVGWHKQPYYDEETKNLSWSKLIAGEGNQTINHSTRLLGREGVMSVDLVIGPEEFDAALPQFKTLLSGFEYRSGKRYAEFKEGDKVAEYGLAALVVGGAGALAFKAGIFQKFWKFILIGLVAVGAFLKKLFFGKKQDPAQSGE
jgi:uncharacterized membrane-anchored protein